MNKVIYLILLLAATCMLASCRFLALKKSHLMENYCPPPCWHGIMPGQTTVEEALVQIKTVPGVQESAIHVKEDQLNPSIQWRTSQGDLTGYIKTKIRIVTSIEIDASYYLGDVISLYGEPDYIFTVPYYHPQYSIYLLYPDDGLLFWSTARQSSGVVKVSSSTVIASIEIYDSGGLETRLKELYSYLGFPKDKVYASRQQHWVGYGTYPLVR